MDEKPGKWSFSNTGRILVGQPGGGKHALGQWRKLDNYATGTDSLIISFLNGFGATTYNDYYYMSFGTYTTPTTESVRYTADKVAVQFFKI